jgi:2-keto-3-deoxy-L-rhamnonate aldolase RhmA
LLVPVKSILHPLRAPVGDGHSLLGIGSVGPHARACGTLAPAGFDFAILDREHGGYDFVTPEAGIAACRDGLAMLREAIA